MGDIQFNEDQEFTRSAILQKQSDLISLVQKWGLVKNEQQAQYVLLGVVAIAIISMCIIWFPRGKTQTPVNQLPPDAFTSGIPPR